jgi:very-short-patch-repair endonuclease
MRNTIRPDQRSRTLAEHAAQMRRVPTPSEAKLFEAVRGGRLGVTFRRQVPVLRRYIVDLLAPAARLVVEVDGGYHRERQRADERRDRALSRAGYQVLRLESELVTSDLPAALALIRAAVDQR